MVLIRRGTLAAVALAAMALLIAAPPAQAACAVTAESVAAADVVFVGVLRAVDGSGVATFEIEEVWRGQQFVTGEMVNIEAANVGIEVPPDPNAPSQRYLVLASERDGVIRTGDAGGDLCARYPFPWDAGYARLKPPTGDPPPNPTESGGLPWLAIALGTAVIAIGLAAILFTPGAMRRRDN